MLNVLERPPQLHSTQTRCKHTHTPSNDLLSQPCACSTGPAAAAAEPVLQQQAALELRAWAKALLSPCGLADARHTQLPASRRTATATAATATTATATLRLQQPSGHAAALRPRYSLVTGAGSISSSLLLPALLLPPAGLSPPSMLPVGDPGDGEPKRPRCAPGKLPISVSRST